MSNPIIYIPTLTSNITRVELPENILYSPNPRNGKYKAKGITIWDNYTFYLMLKYNKSDKHEKAREHYLWLINFIKDNYEDGITLITPDVEWLKYKDEIMEKWFNTCKDYPQLYVPQTWENPDGLNIIGYALRKNTPTEFVHEKWNHCLRHVRDIPTGLLTYDRTAPFS